MKKLMKRIFCVVFSLIMVLSLSACSGNSSDESKGDSGTVTKGAQDITKGGSTDTIKIGVITYMSSARSATLGFFQVGWEVLGKQINDAGGIDGKQIEFVCMDPENDSATAAQRCTDLKNQGCVAIIFACGDDLAPAVSQWSKDNKFPVLLESNTSTEITIKNYSEYAFNCGLNAWSFAKALALSAVGKEGKKNFVFCGTDGAATIDAENLLLLEGKKIDPDFECLASYRVNSSDSEFSSIIASIATTAPDMVLQQGGGPTFVAFAQQGSLFGLFDKTDVYNDFVSDTSTNSSLAEAGTFPYGKTHGVFLLPFWDNSMLDDQMKAFCEDYLANDIAVQNGYIAAADSGLSCYRCAKSIALGIQACVDAGTDYTDSEVLTKAIKGMKWTDSTGDHYFRDFDNQLTMNVYYGTSTESDQYNSPVAKDIITYTADEILPTLEEMKAYAETLGYPERFAE